MQTQIAALMVLAALTAGPAGAQPKPAAAHADLKRTILQTLDVPKGDYQVMIGTSEIGANQSSGRQSHPGPEAGYVLEGSGDIVLDAKPPIRLKAGQSYKLAPGEGHDARGGPHGLKMLVAWVVEKGKPLTASGH